MKSIKAYPLPELAIQEYITLFTIIRSKFPEAKITAGCGCFFVAIAEDSDAAKVTAFFTLLVEVGWLAVWDWGIS